MTDQSRRLLSLIQDCENREQAEIMVHLHGLDMRRYPESTFVGEDQATDWGIILKHNRVRYFIQGHVGEFRVTYPGIKQLLEGT